MRAVNTLLWLLCMMILVSGAISSAVFAPLTLEPDSSASKASMLGYKSHCSFAPASTLMLVAIALLMGYGSLRLWKTKPFSLPSLEGVLAR